ncbi:hypothetical protein TSUD_138200 [Trifolium subterraneum]|uniref:Uncharacterized protein n=1 Tax=Trifolium subterraneum TaxID=3900 RepID=A0A2Z6N0L4_TRISU|nr:hypothetical protein TSUD_138200 [Trifolium subterraneum]
MAETRKTMHNLNFEILTYQSDIAKQKKLIKKLEADAESIAKEISDAKEKLARLEEEHNSKVEQYAKQGYDFKSAGTV